MSWPSLDKHLHYSIFGFLNWTDFIDGPHGKYTTPMGHGAVPLVSKQWRILAQETPLNLFFHSLRYLKKSSIDWLLACAPRVRSLCIGPMCGSTCRDRILSSFFGLSCNLKTLERLEGLKHHQVYIGFFLKGRAPRLRVITFEGSLVHANFLQRLLLQHSNKSDGPSLRFNGNSPTVCSKCHASCFSVKGCDSFNCTQTTLASHEPLCLECAKAVSLSECPECFNLFCRDTCADKRLLTCVGVGVNQHRGATKVCNKVRVCCLEKCGQPSCKNATCRDCLDYALTCGSKCFFSTKRRED